MTNRMRRKISEINHLIEAARRSYEKGYMKDVYEVIESVTNELEYWNKTHKRLFIGLQHIKSENKAFYHERVMDIIETRWLTRHE